ncbi:MAG TPA: hypothetical protein VKQ70_14930 [Caulobacteraceae bacterium]|jgi:hypothetical protein|nr:hypothetical protein [Caulobacteraceae bacterium]
MEPGNGRGLGASGGAVLMALIVAIVVMLMVQVGGGLTRPLMTPPHAATARASLAAQASGAHPAQSQG